MNGAALPVSGARQTWRELRRASRGRLLMLGVALVLGLISAALGLVFPAVLGRLVDLASLGAVDGGTVLSLTALMVAAAAASAIGSALTVVLATRIYHVILADLRERLVARAMRLPQGVIERSGTGDLIARTSDDVTQVADAAPQVIPALSTAGFSIIVTIGGMAALDWRYAAAIAVTLPIYVVTVRWYLATASDVYRAERTAMSARAQHILESLRGRDVVLGFGLAPRRHRVVLRASWDVVQHSLRTRTVQNMFFGRLNFAEYIGMGAILVTGYLLVSAGHSTVGVVTTAMLFFLRLFGPINEMLFVLDTLQSALTSLGRIVGVVTMPDNNLNDRAEAETTLTTGDVHLRKINFAYSPGHPVLHDINISIDRGERIAIVGTSGAGKTTLAQILAGIHRPESGSVARPSNTAMVAQDTHVFSGSLRDNLTLADPDANDTKLSAALSTIGASALLDLLPDGLDTHLGAGGQELTAAQAQQIALARIVLAGPELAIFDEATAEAGSAHATLLDNAADAALVGRTGLVIAHRLSQAATCDRVVVMEQGRIVESGRPLDLIDAGGVYAQLWATWLEGQQRGFKASD